MSSHWQGDSLGISGVGAAGKRNSPLFLTCMGIELGRSGMDSALDTCYMEWADHYPESSVILVCRCLPTGIEPEEENEVVSSSACQKGTLPCIRPPMFPQAGDLAGLTLSAAPQGSCHHERGLHPQGAKYTKASLGKPHFCKYIAYNCSSSPQLAYLWANFS